MDPRMYNAAKKGSTLEDGDFSLVEYLKREEENGYQVTPKGNTILHVAALFGQRGFVGEVLKITPALLCYKNKKNETALHIAANAGQSEVVSELLSFRGEETILVRMTDDIGDTALHKAVRGGHIDIVRMLVKLLLDPEHDFPANKAGETPLYLAAESGFHDALIEILNVCKEPTYVAGPSNRTPLHAAVIQEHTECVRSLWQWNKPLCEELDRWGWNSLHYAVKQGLKEIVSDMLGWKKSLAYLPAGSENDWTTTFHIAASEGDMLMIFVLLNHCPDCWEMLNSNGQNALHVALLNGHEMLVYFFYGFGFCNSLVDEADNEGNTPLHLLAASGDHVPQIILDHPIAKKMAFNKQNQTPLDIALSRTWTTKKEKLVHDFCSINGQLGQRDFKVKRKTETIGNIQQMRKEDDHDKAKRVKIEIAKFMKSTQLHVVVATLIMTVTFAAGFTLPGDLDSDTYDSPTKGRMAILLKRAAFRAFVISDVLAFSCSAGAIFIYFFMADMDVDYNEERKWDWFKMFRRSYNIAGSLQGLAMGAVVVAFVTGMYATLANSLLANSVCVIGCVTVLVYFSIIFWV
ncbi:ankyrin repeat-containing protein At5g02620-like isoform X1 [Solanum stenotomum]|uniref:ankyrin repeat-containing protein At5g02620-like isoform X1 n=1 Tax=Solanum stenotomum TaxID=172797 RepID=UPI0020D0C9C9|nr:ankyrin repeat-containing protein At5g02620-like isoform X1 [Solanum stenotomum]